MRTYLADSVLLPQGWTRDVLIEVEPSGNIARVTTDAKAGAAEAIREIVLPGMIDLHSHAFQRALAGLTQRLGSDRASFWTWRDTMYAFAEKITPDDERAIAAQLYVELLKGGYTSVVEFHYLHHAPEGQRYAEPVAMSVALHEAALEAGIALTLLPDVYMQAGVDGSPLSGRSAASRWTPRAGAGSRRSCRGSSPATRTAASGWRCIRSERSRRRPSPPPWQRCSSSLTGRPSISIWPSSRRIFAIVSSATICGRCAC